MKRRLTNEQIKKMPERYRKQIEEQLSKGRNNTAIPISNTKSFKRALTLGAQEVPRLDTPCFISVHSIRKRKPDLDGLSSKAVIDGVVSLAILPDDREEYMARSPVYTHETGSIEITIITMESTNGNE